MIHRGPKWLVVAVVAIAVIAVVSTGESRAAGSQKPVKQRTMHGDGGVGAPATLEELWSMSPLIVDATIHGARPADQTMRVPGRPEEDQSVVITAYLLRINEVFRDIDGVTKTGRPVEVLQVGGDRDRGSYVESITDPTFDRLQEGERYVLFLKASNSGKGVFVTATNTADGALLLSDIGLVKGSGRAPLSMQLRRFNREDLLNRLRTLAETRR